MLHDLPSDNADICKGESQPNCNPCNCIPFLQYQLPTIRVSDVMETGSQCRMSWTQKVMSWTQKVKQEVISMVIRSGGIRPVNVGRKLLNNGTRRGTLSLQSAAAFELYLSLRLIPGEISGCEEKNSFARLFPPTWQGVNNRQITCTMECNYRTGWHFASALCVPSSSPAPSLSTCPSLLTVQSCQEKHHSITNIPNQ